MTRRVAIVIAGLLLIVAAGWEFLGLGRWVAAGGTAPVQGDVILALGAHKFHNAPAIINKIRESYNHPSDTSSIPWWLSKRPEPPHNGNEG